MINKINEAGCVTLTVDKTDIDTFNHASQLSFLKHVKENAKIFEGKIIIWVLGYDNDERELWEIGEVKNYFNFLDRCFPYWFFFLNRVLPGNQSPILLMISLLVPIEKVIVLENEKKYSELNSEIYHEFLDIHFFYLNELTTDLNIPETRFNEIAAEIKKIIRL